MKAKKSRPVFETGKYPYVVVCDGPWDVPEMKGCGRVVLTVEEFNRQMNNPDAFWKCPVCACGVMFDDTNYAAWYERNREQTDGHIPGCRCPDCEEQPILGEG